MWRDSMHFEFPVLSEHTVCRIYIVTRMEVRIRRTHIISRNVNSVVQVLQRKFGFNVAFGNPIDLFRKCQWWDFASWAQQHTQNFISNNCRHTTEPSLTKIHLWTTIEKIRSIYACAWNEAMSKWRSTWNEHKRARISNINEQNKAKIPPKTK